jgi:hypothetical protein
MANEVARAWKENRSIFIGTIAQYSRSWALFTPSREHSWPRQVFTSWHFTLDRVGKDTQEPMDKHVQLDVDLGVSFRGLGLPRLYIKDWINGLCFCDGSSPQRMLFPWPDHFMEDTIQ